jgi:hypothetical protein
MQPIVRWLGPGLYFIAALYVAADFTKWQHENNPGPYAPTYAVMMMAALWPLIIPLGLAATIIKVAKDEQSSRRP